MAVDVDALARTMDETLAVFESLDDQELTSPSACEGWTVHTVLAHLTVTVATLAGQDAAPMHGAEDDFERAVDDQAKAFAHRSSAELLGAFRDARPKVVDTFRTLPEQVADLPVPMGSAGTYSFGQLAAAITFDQTCHVHFDVLEPRGPVARDLPPIDEGRLRAAIGWLVGGIPQMTTAQFRTELTDPLACVLTGPGGRTFVVRLDEDGTIVVDDGGEGTARATVESTTTDFLRWATTRERQDGRLRVTGDEGYAARVLSTFRVY